MLGMVGGAINGVIALSIITSILFYSFKIDNSTTERLNTSVIFKYIYIIKTTLVDYGR